jgi:hypothetical protein
MYYVSNAAHLRMIALKDIVYSKMQRQEVAGGNIGPYIIDGTCQCAVFSIQLDVSIQSTSKLEKMSEVSCQAIFITYSTTWWTLGEISWTPCSPTFPL